MRKEGCKDDKWWGIVGCSGNMIGKPADQNREDGQRLEEGLRRCRRLREASVFEKLNNTERLQDEYNQVTTRRHDFYVYEEGYYVRFVFGQEAWALILHKRWQLPCHLGAIQP